MDKPAPPPAPLMLYLRAAPDPVAPAELVAKLDHAAPALVRPLTRRQVAALNAQTAELLSRFAWEG